MREYESVIILKPDLSEQEVSSVISKIENTIKNFGKVTVKNDLAIKKLVCEVKNYKEGRYIEKYSTEAICELERVYRIVDEIIKFIVVKK